jgi:hypothetical protein
MESIEYVYARANPVDFAHVIEGTIGHRAQIEGAAVQVGKYAEQEMSNAILSRSVGTTVNRVFADRTGAWSRWGTNGQISYWTLLGTPQPASLLTWDEFCQRGGTGLGPGLPDMDYMAYVP